MDKKSIEAVIFDLDGVVTKTAKVHARSWKVAFDKYLKLRKERDGGEFVEFTDKDYLKFVDGKPRYNGVKSFLESRNINLSMGELSDSPELETICGIGNCKNTSFLELLNSEGVEIYESTVELIKELKKNGIRIGVASSSKNCRFVLEAAGLTDLFETRVDGEVSLELGLCGKPEPDIFVRAAQNIGAQVSKSVCVEDASSGVAAGRNGGFALVIGIARENNKKELLENGADVAVDDLDKIDIAWMESWFNKKAVSLFENWDNKPQNLNEIWGADIVRDGVDINPQYICSPKEAIFCGKKLVFFLDYDGTLTPIVDRPEDAKISLEIKSVVETLSKKCLVAAVSGRMREDVESLLGIKGLIYAGSHGFDILGPDIKMIEPRAQETIPLVGQVIKEFESRVGSIEGVIIENKKFSTAVHYRLADASAFPKIKEVIDDVVGRHKELRILHGKKVFEIMPAIHWNKGMAVRWVMEALNLNWEDYCVVYIGDDTTDEDAFRVVRSRGRAILVSEKNQPSSADFVVKNPDEVKKLFEQILKS